VEDLAQVVGGGPLLEVWPEPVHRLLAMETMVRREREQLDEV
jgi:hypothetical protein